MPLWNFHQENKQQTSSVTMRAEMLNFQFQKTFVFKFQ